MAQADTSIVRPSQGSPLNTRARFIRSKVAEIPVQNRREQTFSGDSRCEKFGEPLEVILFFRNLETTEISFST